MEDWLGGGNIIAAATRSVIFFKQSSLHTDDEAKKLSTVLAHEIAHQWWPHTVFLEERDMAFLSEGMAEYAAYLFNESRGVKSPRDSLNNHPLLRALVTRAKQGKDLPLQQVADLRALPTHYLKAMYVHHMLRHIVGDSVFIDIYREFSRRYALMRAHLEDFEQLVTEISGRDLRWFFDQWVRRKGVPRLMLYNVKTHKSEHGWTTRGRVRIVGYDKYTTFVPVGVETSTGISTTRVWIGQDTTHGSIAYRHDVPFTIVTQSRPMRAVLDPEGDVLKIRKLPPKFNDLREPADGTMIVGTGENADVLLAIARRDSVPFAKRRWWMLK